MSIDPSLALQRAITSLLNGDEAVKALIDLRVYDDVDPLGPFPYVSFGPSQDNQQDADCILGSEVFIQLDVWSRQIGFEECKAISKAVTDALHQVTTTQDGLTFEIERQFTNHVRDPDGITSHGILQFRADIDT